MLNESRLQAIAEPMDPDRTLDAVARGGLPLSLPLRVRLASSPAACRALMLRRLTELTFGPSRLSRRLTRELLADQRPDGSWEQAALPTACALAALHRVALEHRADAGPARAIDRGRLALAAMQRPDGLLVGPADHDAGIAAGVGTLALYLLDRIDGVWDAVRRSDLARRLAAEADPLPAPDRLLHDMAGPGGGVASADPAPTHATPAPIDLDDFGETHADPARGSSRVTPRRRAAGRSVAASPL